MFIIKNRILFFCFSGALIAISLASLFFYGLNLGTDFKGGSILQVSYLNNRPTIAEINNDLQALNLGNFSAQSAGTNDLIVRTKDLSQADKETILKALSAGGKYQLKENSFSTIGPSLGKELEQKGMIAIAIVVVLIILFVAFAFRQVSFPVKSWKYGIIAIIALIHDLIISTGAMSLLAHFTGAEADALFLTALLTILGLSVNDTIVIFDRVRENLRHRVGNTFEDSIGISLDQTIVRSINVTLTIVLVLLAMVAFGPASTRIFSSVLLVGMAIGAYSSIFVAAPLLVEFEKRSNKAVKR